MSAPSSTDPSRSSTPNPATNSRFTAQNSTAEDLLKSQTVGLVQLSDFRKRRAEALEAKEREQSASGASTPARDGAETPQPAKKKRKPIAAKGKLSFGLDDEEENGSSASAAPTPKRSQTPDERAAGNGDATSASEKEGQVIKKKLGPNTSVSFVPKAMTKSALLREAQTREQLRKEFLAMQEAVKATEIVIPFVFYDGTNIPGGRCRIKKGDHVWFFLDKARKVGAEMGVGGDKSRREWARVGVDDLMLVKGEIIIPHHYDFYYFMLNKSIGFDGPLFPYSAKPTSATPKQTNEEDIDLSSYDPMAKPSKSKDKKGSSIEDSQLEGYNDDPSLTKVVDRRWYERNKHIFPASVWEEFDPTKDYSTGIRKDQEGNSFFFS